MLLSAKEMKELPEMGKNYLGMWPVKNKTKQNKNKQTNKRTTTIKIASIFLHGKYTLTLDSKFPMKQSVLNCPLLWVHGFQCPDAMG